MTNNKKNKLNAVLNEISGRFFTVTHRRKGKVSRYCAKLVGHTPNYLSIYDVNSDSVIKMSKDALVSLNCGQKQFVA